MTDWIFQYSTSLSIRDAREQVHKPYIDAYTRLADRKATISITTEGEGREDLLAAQKARSTLEGQLSTLTLDHTQLQKIHQSSTSQLVQLTRQKAETERRLRDREEEIRSKKKLVEDTQDEMVSLQLQLNMAEQRREELERENKELVERWMKRMGEEVEKVNRDSRWE